MIVNDNDVMIVDDHVSPAAAWVLLEEVKTLTKKPVTTVINTHFHFDHAHGNQIFDPTVQIIGHEFTRQMLLGNPTTMPLYQNYITGAGPDRNTAQAHRRREGSCEGQTADAAPGDGEQLRLAEGAETHAAERDAEHADDAIPRQPRNPDSLSRRGHTAGDVVVFLPRERLVMTAILTSAPSNMSDSYPQDWVASLDALKKLDFETVLPGTAKRSPTERRSTTSGVSPRRVDRDEPIEEGRRLG